MRIIEYISEITKPVGAIYLRFKVRMGDVPPNASREEKRKSLYLTAFTGFANDPKELTAANARLRFMKLNSMNDIVKMIKEIMGDKTFISAKSMTIYMDLPDSAFNTFPYLKEFMGWVGKNGGDRIKVEWKPEGEGEEDPLKKKRKPNPNKDIKQVDYDPADPRYTIHFTVSDRFYDAIRKSMPNLMQYKGSGQDFRMPKELFDKFRDAAKQRFGDIGLKILKKAHTAESLEEGANTLFAVKVVDPKTGNEKTIEISALTASEAKSKVAGRTVEVDGEKKHYKVISVKSAWNEAKDVGKQLSVEQLATISDAALDSAYGYGRSQPGNTFGWQANLKSAAFAKQMIDKGVTDIEAISDAIHKGWNVTAQAFVKNPMMFDDSKTMAPEKLQAKIAQRQKLMTQQYAQLPEDEKEKDRVVAHAMLQAITGGQPGVEEDITDEGGPASRSLCLSKKSNSQLGASQLASCKSQGLRAREGDKSHKFKDGKRVTVGGHKIKGKAHGGPLPDWGTRGAKKKK